MYYGFAQNRWPPDAAASGCQRDCGRRAGQGAAAQKRTDNHCWGYPGGSTELDERVEDAAARELLEETGLTANRLELFGVFSGPELHYIYPNGDEVSNIDVVFLCRDYSGQLSCQEEESEALRFFAPGQLPEQLSPPIVIPLKIWERKRLGQE